MSPFEQQIRTSIRKRNPYLTKLELDDRVNASLVEAAMNEDKTRSSEELPFDRLWGSLS